MKKGQEPAFPIVYQEYGNIQYDVNLGMSKRFYAACAAMQGILANPSIEISQYESIIKTAYIFADELLKQENNELT